MADKRKKADRFLDYAERAMDWLADRPLPKAIGAVISNPTPQEFGAQVANLGASTSKSLQDFSNRVASDPVEAGSLVGPLGAMVAFHGSPHKFDKFSMDKIGTGEGAQAYGHGLYFAGNPKIAEAYKNKLEKVSYSGANINPSDPSHVALAAYEHFKDKNKAIEYLKKQSKLMDTDVNISAAKLLETNAPLPTRVAEGSLYKVDIPDESLMLDWDAPLMQQPEEVKALMSRYLGIEEGKLPSNYSATKNISRGNYIIVEEKPTAGPFAVGRQVIKHGQFEGYKTPEEAINGYFQSLTGKELYNTLASDMKPGGASEYLSSLGVKGIKYFDAGSRAAKQGSRNYVVFDDKEIKILERNAEKFLEE